MSLNASLPPDHPASQITRTFKSHVLKEATTEAVRTPHDLKMEPDSAP